MAWEPEGLIAHLLMLISCAGEHGEFHCPPRTNIGPKRDAEDRSTDGLIAQPPGETFASLLCGADEAATGCSVEALLRAIRDSSAPSGSSCQTVKQETRPDRAASTVWRWLVERNDVSVGRERRYNHFALDELLAGDSRRGKGDGNASQEAPRDAALASSEGDAVRVYTTEATMWEAITGHAVDYKRVPRSEWLLLLGIASSKSEGILQGDLCRLVDQDKRSVPKRTDALAKKGYIAKRTTLVRGTKTSKMWLKSFAPPLPKENKDSTATPKAEMNLSRQMLAENLDPVPWHTRWTGEYIDYAALATTIMAVAKEWDVIRVRHLKAKLGILGMRWQMKILAKTCRFLNSRGAIQYVSAKLEDRVFKDCVRYHRDLTPDDWSLYLATGKRPGKPARGGDAGDGDDDDDQVSPQHANNLRLSMCPPWTLDKPLPHAIVRIVQCLGDGGMSNSDIYTLTLGVTFNRFLSSMTGSMSTSDTQPSGLKHLQLRSEHFRAGKVASYLFFMPPIPALKTAAGDSVDTGAGPVGAEVYGFSPATAVPPVTEKPMTLTEICGLQLPRKGIERQQAQRPGTRSEDASGQPGEGLPAGREMEHVSGKPSPDVLEEEETGPRQGPSLMVKLKLAPEALLRALAQGQPPRPRKSPQESRENPGPGPEGDDGAADAAERGEPAPRPEDDGDTAPRAASTRRGRGQGRGGRRGRGSRGGRGAVPSSSRQWRCDKCGGSWKNSVGLKYHLEKSQTSCNASYVPTAPPRPSQGGRQVSFFRPRASDSPGESESESPGVGSNGTGMDATTWPSSTSVRRNGPPADIRIREQVDETPHSRNAFSPPIAESWQCPGTGLEGPGRFSPPHANAGLLLDDGASRRRQVPPLEGHGRWDTLVATSSEKDSGRDAVESIEETGMAAVAPDADADASQDESRHGQAQDETPGPGHSGRGADGAPDDAGRGRRAKTNKETCSRIRSLVQDMLKERGGAMLGGKPLWHVVTTAWSTVFPDAAVPSERDCQSAVNGMLRNKAVTEHWHAFRDYRGMFAKCQLILGPGVDAFSPECLGLMDQVRHSRLRPAQGDEMGKAAAGRDSRQRVRGRRPLAKEVAVLDAPIYAAQLAAKREAEDAGDGPRRAKRVKYSAKPKPSERDGLSPSPERRGAGGIRPAASGRSRALDDEHDDALPPAALRFLEPNTQLEEDGPRSDSGETPWPPDRHSPTRRGQEELCREQGGSYVFDDITPISASNGTSWPWLDGQQLDRLGASFTMRGWIPYGKWFKWATLTQAVERQYASRKHRSRSSAPASSPHQRFVSRVLACLDVELLWRACFVNAVRGEAGPHTIFVGCSVEPDEHAARPPPRNLAWPAEGQLTPTSAKKAVSEWEEDKTRSSSLDLDDNDEEEEEEEDEARARAWTAAMPSAAAQTAGGTATRQPRTKRVALVSRALTALPAGGDGTGEGGADVATDSQDEVMAALVAVRSLLGGIDKAIDWGLLVSIFPSVGLGGLRRFWTEARKEQAVWVANYTRVFQERLIAALESEEMPMVDFDRPLDYDWGRLIAWTMQVASQEGFQVPGSRESLDRQYRLDDARGRGDDWREKYFHVQSSFFARYEAVTSAPGAVTAGEAGAAARGERPAVDDVAVARSWIKSLCSTAQTKYSVQQVRAKLLGLSAGSRARRSALFRAAVGQLVQQRVICRRGRRPGPRVGGSGPGGRPYRLNEWYVSALARMAQGAKYDEAAAFKAQLDAAFGRGQALRVPYTLSDGATLALTNLQAAGCIRLVPVDVPDIPFGFEPGNYESRKYPKSYYHFALDAVPTPAYRFDADIAVLGAVVARGPPSEGPRGALPQWVDVFGRPDVERWSDVLGAFCFALATRDSMTVEAVCSALSPVLDGFEAQLVVDWGKSTGVLTDLVGGMGTAVGDWWWLVVPWLRSHGPR